MTDRELLELAAKAAGLSHPDGWDWIRNPLGYSWNPLEDDGDALRLAVRVGIDVSKAQIEFWDKHSTDPLAATRRAITRAAAEIGRNME